MLIKNGHLQQEVTMRNVILEDTNAQAGGLLDTGAAARLLGVSTSFLNKKRVTGDGPAFFKVGRRVLYDRAELESWLRERRFANTSEVRAA